MFTHLLNSFNELFGVIFTDYANSHYLKKFQKAYKGKRWDFTLQSIKLDLSRLGLQNNTTQRSGQIDELKYSNNHWLAKYDFKIAGTNISKKDSDNRLVLHIDGNLKLIEILLIYNKNDLPKNKKETEYIYSLIEKQFPNINKLF